MTYKFVIVANRLPVTVSKVDGELVYTPSNGGLATAMSSLQLGDAGDDKNSRLWVGWPGIASDDLTPTERKAVTRKLQSYGCYPVFLTRQQIQLFYEGYCNDTIWPMFHYFQSVAVHDNRYWAAYQEVNHLYSRAVSRYADEAAKIWVHDYQLMLLPRMLRERLPQSLIGFFMHIPFPSYEIYRLLPERRQLLEGVLGADLVGFHIYDYARHFMSSVLRALGFEHKHGVIHYGKRRVTVDAFPIGIDYEKWTDALNKPETIEEIQLLTETYKGRKIIVSVDRLDYSKGIMHRLEAFEQFLAEYPRYHKKVALVMVAVPSRIEVEAYKDLRHTIEQAISRINGQYGSVDWTPISYQFKNLPFHQVVALYAKADVALVTPLRDGMNLVAKEFIASKQRSTGVLVLSELTGAVDELPESLRINPNDTANIVSELARALKMPKAEQRRRLDAMQRRISSYTVARWANDFIEQLAQTSEARLPFNHILTPPARSSLLRDFRSAKQRLLLLDYDGVLRGFVSSPDPMRAAPSNKLLNDLRALLAQPNTTLCIISGRTREALESWFGKLGPGLTLAAEHGAWLRQDGNWSEADIPPTDYKQVLLPLLRRYADRTPGARIEEKAFALVWHYRNVPAELAYARNSSLKHELSNLLASSGLNDISVHSGNKIIEIKPRSISKGSVAAELLADTDAGSTDFVLCIGDDYTDEDMFRALPDSAYTIKVGPGETQARFRLDGVPDVQRLLHELTIEP